MRIEAPLIAALALASAAWAQNEPVANSATPPAVDIAPLDAAPIVGTAGLLPATVTGLPVTLWQASEADRLGALIGAVDPPVPALHGLMRVLMLAEAAPPQDDSAGLAHLATRLTWLRKAGQLDEELALIELVGADQPALFARWADLNLLLGRSDPPCRALARDPGLSPDMALRVFCTARAGDVPRADLLYRSALALGQMSARQADLLARFLDAEWAESQPDLVPPVRPTPLEFRLFEALGEPLPTAPLPLVFATLDLGGDNGWKAQIEAAERLARHGALPANRLLGIYSQRRPAASGGVWDRVAALQRLERALEEGKTDEIEQRLTRVWPQMASAGLLVPFADLFAARLAPLPLTGRAARQARFAQFLSSDYMALAAKLAPDGPNTAFLTAIAEGRAPGDQIALPHALPVAAAFDAAGMPPVLSAQLREDRLGEVLLRAIVLIASGADGNARDLTDGLATLRALGLEDTARRTALQLMILTAERARR